MTKEKPVMKIVKIGHKNSKTTVHGQEEKNGDVINMTLESDTPANPEFHTALKDLGKYMCDLLGCPAEWKQTHSCTSVSIGYEDDDRINAVVTLYIQLSKFNNGITVNTPCLREKLPGKGGGGQFMTPKMLDLVKEVIDEAQKYYDGDRAQLEMPVDEPTGEEP